MRLDHSASFQTDSELMQTIRQIAVDLSDGRHVFVRSCTCALRNMNSKNYHESAPPWDLCALVLQFMALFFMET